MSTRKGKLTERQKKFVEAYLICGNKRKAARMAGYVPSYSQGAFRMPAVKAYLEKRREELFRQDDFTNEVIYVIAIVAAGGEFIPKLNVSDEKLNNFLITDEAREAAVKILMEAAGIKPVIRE